MPKIVVKNNKNEYAKYDRENAFSYLFSPDKKGAIRFKSERAALEFIDKIRRGLYGVYFPKTSSDSSTYLEHE